MLPDAIIHSGRPQEEGLAKMVAPRAAVTFVNVSDRKSGHRSLRLPTIMRSSLRVPLDPEDIHNIRTFLDSELAHPTKGISEYWTDRLRAGDVIFEDGAAGASEGILEPDTIDLADMQRWTSRRILPPQIGLKFLRFLQLLLRADLKIAVEKQRVRVADHFYRTNLDALARRLDAVVQDPFLTLERLDATPFRQFPLVWPLDYLRFLHALNVIHQCYGDLSGRAVLEIGAAHGFLAHLMHFYWGTHHLIVDLPQTLVMGYAITKYLFPHVKALLPHQITSLDDHSFVADHEFIFMVPEQTTLLPPESCDVAINMDSFQEMEGDTVKGHFRLVDRSLTSKGMFYVMNREEKRVDSSYVARFEQYPWYEHYVTVFDNPIDMPHQQRHWERVVRKP